MTATTDNEGVGGSLEDLPKEVKEEPAALSPNSVAAAAAASSPSNDPEREGGDGSSDMREEEKEKATGSVDAGNSGEDTGKGVEEVEEARWWCCRCCTERLQVYASHFLSSWGDRMWMFAGGIFLLEVTPGSLRLAAIYGAALALTVIILGAPVGRWVDRTSRLRAAQLSLSVQNLMVCVCAALLVLITSYPELFTNWDGWALVLAEVGVIITACVAQVGTLGSKLAIEKDWILVICGRDITQLARMNSVLRTVDLSTEVLAPVIVGAVMTSAGLAVGGIVIAGWNVGSLLVEYGLLHHLFYSNPHLQKGKGEQKTEVSKEDVAKEERAESGGGRTASEDLPDVEAERQRRRQGQGMSRALERLAVAWSAWRAYMHHPVRNAGLGLALLFMTVLAFDNYSRAFVYDSGVSETVLGVLTAVASLFGIFGSLAFPVLRKKVGLIKTGLVGFTCETLCLTLCVASVFAPGSPFDASAILWSNPTAEEMATPLNTTAVFTNTTAASLATPPAPQYTISNVSSVFNESRNLVVDFNSTLEEQGEGLPLGLDSKGSLQKEEEELDFTFVILFMTGVITSRFGLWLADLTVTQILQEGVEEGQRGAINGVQSSLNQSLDLLRSILLIILPLRETFGFLILLSFLFVSMALAMFAFYARSSLTSTGKPISAPEGQQLQSVTV